LLTTIISFSVSIVLILYLAPLIHSTDYIAGKESLPMQEIKHGLVSGKQVML
jgi:hypothetical protein